MGSIEKIRDIFAILHDGVIIQWAGDKDKLTLKVGCQYLAELIDLSFEDFYLELEDVTQLAFVPWMNPAELEQEYYADLNTIFKAQLGILYAEIDIDFVKISCNQSDPTLNYCGGTLYLNCKSIRIFDQVKREVIIDNIDKLCNEYWDRCQWQ